MVPSPLHPAVVHFPLVLAVLLPFIALVAIGLIARGRNARAVWVAPFAFAALLSISAFVALKTGEQEEERVENVVSENTLHAHEEAAEQFLIVSVVLLLIAAAGMLGGIGGNAARIATTVGAVVVLLMGIRVGKAGGELVYKHGAASAYVTGAAAGGGADGAANEPAAEPKDDDD